MAFAVGSIFLACSGTIDTPTEEYPRQSSRAAANDDDDDAPATPARGNDSQSASANPPRQPAPAASDDDDDEPAAPAASGDADDEEPAAGDDEPAAGDDDAEAPAAPAGGALAFETDIYPILSTTCAPCHVGTGQGLPSIGDPDVATAFDVASGAADRIVARVTTGTMPPQCAGGAPGDTGCMKAEDLETVQAWIEAGTPE